MSDPTSDIVVDLNFVVDSADLFRASVRLARTRIIVGLAVSVALISGLTVFFFMIDEQMIFLKTSALFVGLPLVAVGGQVLRLHAACKQYARSLSGSQRQVSYSFSEKAESFRVTSGESFSEISWHDVRKVTEDRQRFLLFLNKFNIRVVPKSAFRDADSIHLLRNMLQTKLGRRACLRT